MLRKTTIVLAIAVLLGGSGLSTAAVARGKDSGSGFEASNAHHFARDVGAGADRRGTRVHGLRRPLRAFDQRDVWGHWGSYYGPMVAVPF